MFIAANGVQSVRSLFHLAAWSLFASVLVLPPALAMDSDSDSVSSSDRFDCGLVAGFGGGTYTWEYRARLEATVTPYITDDRPGEFTATVNVSTSHDPNCFFPSVASLARPQIYFGGSGGALRIGWNASNAFRGSSVQLNNSGDRFLPGFNYRVTGSDGASSFSVTPSVSAAGVGLSISPSTGSPIVLFGNSSNPRRIEIGNVVWDSLAVIPPFRGNFRDGGNFALQEFKISTGSDNQSEFGTINITVPVRKANEGAGVLTLTGQSVGTLRGRVRYIRGNHLREPEIEIVSERDVVAPGETVKVDVIIRNRSGLRLNGGRVVLDTAALRPVLFPEVGSLEFDPIPVNGSRTVSFELEAFTEGQASIEVEVDGGWASPVPQDRKYTRSRSVANGITVSADGTPGPGGASLESPQQGSFESGIGLIRGWVCDAETVEIQLNDEPRQQVAYGTTRNDTLIVCGRSDTGFGLTFNWNNIGAGTHPLVAFADGEEFGRAEFTVTTLGVPFLVGASGEYRLDGFPEQSRDINVRWSEAHQNFVIAGVESSSSAVMSMAAVPVGISTASAHLESPRDGEIVSGIGRIRGWACDATGVAIQVNDQLPHPVAYGLDREDKILVCNNPASGFSHVLDWNELGAGQHTLRVLVDGKELERVSVTVTESDSLLVPTNTSPANLESPQPGSFESGIGLIRGWACDASVIEIQINNQPRQQVAYGTTRNDTLGICGRSDTGFGLTFNWNNIGAGTHTLVAFADGEEFGRAEFTVTTLGVPFLEGVSGEYDVLDFPSIGRSIRLRWSQPHQNFVIMDAQ